MSKAKQHARTSHTHTQSHTKQKARKSIYYVHRFKTAMIENNDQVPAPDKRRAPQNIPRGATNQPKREEISRASGNAKELSALRRFDRFVLSISIKLSTVHRVSSSYAAHHLQSGCSGRPGRSGKTVTGNKNKQSLFSSCRALARTTPPKMTRPSTQG